MFLRIRHRSDGLVATTPATSGEPNRPTVIPFESCAQAAGPASRPCRGLFAIMTLYPILLMPAAPVLIPRDVLFGNPQRATPRLSPDARRMAYLAPDEGVLNVWLRTIGQEDDRAITKDRGRGIRIFFWAEDNEHVLYLQDRDGDENWHLYSVHPKTNTVRDLSPYEGVRVEDVLTDPNRPDEILLAMNERDRQVFDLQPGQPPYRRGEVGSREPR